MGGGDRSEGSWAPSQATGPSESGEPATRGLSRPSASSGGHETLILRSQEVAAAAGLFLAGPKSEPGVVRGPAESRGVAAHSPLKTQPSFNSWGP